MRRPHVRRGMVIPATVGLAVALCLLNYHCQDVYRRRAVLYDVMNWPNRRTELCGGNFTGYGNKFFRLRWARYDPRTDSFQLSCSNQTLPLNYHFVGSDHGVGKYSRRIRHVRDVTRGDNVTRKHDVTIIVDRSYAHNYYHAVQDWYNIFLLTMFFDLEYRTVQIFLIDRSPLFHTDAHWDRMFPRLSRCANFTSAVIFEDAIFSIPGPENPMEFWDLQVLPYMEDFRQTILTDFNLTTRKTLNCKNLTITLILRRDYFYHPNTDILQRRNTQRKFQNEEEIVKFLHRMYHNHTIRIFIPENLTLRDQLEIIVTTDILVGMHGCALTNVWFMPAHGAIFEMYPAYWTIKKFFSSLARWRGVHYSYWQNTQAENEYPNHYTRVPPAILLGHVDRLRQRIGCDP